MNKFILDQHQWIERISTPPKIADRFQIFFNPLNVRSLRLTKIGYNIFEALVDLKIYRFQLQKGLLPKSILQLERNMTMPYYIQGLHNFHTFDEQLAIILTLNQGNLQFYLNSVEET